MTPTIQLPTADTGRFLAILSTGEWIHAREICRRLDCGDKTVRDLASASGGRIASGQKGYKLTERLTGEEITHSVNWLRSQARKMNERADEIETAWARTREMELAL